MTKKITNLLGIIITILAGTYFYITCCSECGMSSKKEVVAPVAHEPTSYPFAFDKNGFTYRTNNNFNFNSSSPDILLPVTQDVQDGIARLKTFLAENSDKVVNITGYYKSDEENNSAFPNLGVARANTVKNYLVSKGIPTRLMSTFGALKDELVPKENVYLGPLGYDLADMPEDTDDKLKELHDRINSSPLILNFNTAEASINLSMEQRRKIADISTYLDKVEGSTVNIVGHTDNTGQRAKNIVLGQERADFAKNYLMRNGIPESKISTSSKGSDEPIASNETEEGRAQNRRTIITLN